MNVPVVPVHNTLIVATQMADITVYVMMAFTKRTVLPAKVT